MPQQPTDEIVVAVNIVKIRSLFMAVLSSTKQSQVGGEQVGAKGGSHKTTSLLVMCNRNVGEFFGNMLFFRNAYPSNE